MRLQALAKDLQNKADRQSLQSQVDFINEGLLGVSKELVLKAGVKEICSLLDQKCNNTEIKEELSYCK